MAEWDYLLHCGLWNDPQSMGIGQRHDDVGVLMDQAKPRAWEELVGQFQRGLDELFDRGARQGARRVLRRLATQVRAA